MSDGTMSSKDVNRALREVVWPALKPEGFTRRTARTAWRDRADQVDVINFWSLGSYHSGVYRVTGYSFQISLGIHPRVRTTEDTPVKGGLLYPAEYQCDFRLLLQKNIDQPETTRPEVWYVRPDSSNLLAVAEDSRDLLMSDGLSWFAELDGLERMLAVARTAPEADPTEGTWGMGNLGSPARQELLSVLEASH